MTDIHFSSSVAIHLKAYLDYSKSLGHNINNLRYELLSIDTFLNKEGFVLTYINYDIYRLWRESIAGWKFSTIYHKVSIFRRICLFMTKIGIECYIPILPRFPHNGFTPYIFSHDEMNRIFITVDALRVCNSCSKNILIATPALIRLLYSTGIRISEALSIQNVDVDFTRNVIILNHTKNGSQRLAPISDSMQPVLLDYIRYRNKMPFRDLTAPNSSLFVSGLGKPFSRDAVGDRFDDVLSKAGIVKTDCGPRLHDLRHTSCVHAFIKLIKSGKDPYTILPALSTFMGHKSISATEKYLRLTQQMYPDLFDADTSVTSSIYNIINRALIINNHDQ